MFIKKIVPIALTAAMVFSLVGSPLSSNNCYGAKKAKKKKVYKVVRVIDGDTIVVKRKKKKFKVRLLGVNSPESVHPQTRKNDKCGKRASNYTKKKLLNKKVTLTYGKDKYDRFGRRLAYVYRKKKMFNKMLLSAGHAKVQMFKPNTKYKKTFKNLEFEAKVNNKGLWKYETPSGSHSCIFVGVISTKKFHRADCSYVEKVKKKNYIQFDKKQEAVDLGYEACLVCEP